MSVQPSVLASGLHPRQNPRRPPNPHGRPPPHVTDAILHVIKGAGYSLGETTTINRDGTSRVVLNAVDARTGESFTVSAVGSGWIQRTCRIG